MYVNCGTESSGNSLVPQTSKELLSAFISLRSGKGSFDCAAVRFARVNSAQDDKAKVPVKRKLATGH